MLSFKFKLMVIKLLRAILEIHINQMIVDPKNTPHQWSELMVESRELIKDFEDQIDDLSRPQYIPEFMVEMKEISCDSKTSGTT